MQASHPDALNPSCAATGATHHGLQLLASYLMQASPQDILDDLQRQMNAWPEQDTVQDDLDVLHFMFERLDHGVLDTLRQALGEAHAAAHAAIAALRTRQQQDAALLAQWQPLAARAGALLGELRALTADWNPLFGAAEQFQIRMDPDAFASPPNYRHFRPELTAELQRLLDQVDQQLLDQGYSEAVALMRALYAACASLDPLSEACLASWSLGQSLREQSAAAKALWGQHQQALLAELQKMPLSGQYALLRLSQQAPFAAPPTQEQEQAPEAPAA